MSDSAIKILAVDDEKFNLILLTESMKRFGYKVEGTDSPMVAIEMIKHGDFDIALLDIIMPGLDGFEARRIIRDNKPRLPIIFLTSLIDTFDNDLIQKISEDNHSYYVKKPFNANELAARIESVVAVVREEESTKESYSEIMDDLKLAAEVQQFLIPDWLHVDESILISSLYEPSQLISGDIFDVINISENRYFFFVGDISGHGIQAALYMSAVQAMVKMIVGSGSRETAPCDVLNQLNYMFSSEISSNSYMTAITGVIDFDANLMTFYNAGHPGIFEYNPVTKLMHEHRDTEKGGFPVGWDSSFVYREVDMETFGFADESMFFLVTDGILEIMDAEDNQISRDTIIELIKSISDVKEPIFVPFVFRESLEQIGYTKCGDDITMLMFKKLSPQTEDKPVLQRMLPPNITQVDGLCRDCAEFILHHGGNSKLAAKVELLVGEFLNNVIMHGHKPHQQARPGIHVKVVIEDTQVIVKVHDKGGEWHYDEPDKKVEEEDDEAWTVDEKFATAGRGMKIIRELATETQRLRSHGVNETVFTINKQDY
jgi:phosphoserine phosphatase RsbU/P